MADGIPTPNQVFVGGHKSGKTALQMQQIREEGRLEGRAQAREEMLSWLEKRYMNNDVERGGPVGEAILKITRELSEHFRGLARTPKRGNKR
jgi:hypothetical protein